MLVDKVFISWIGPSSLGVERNEVTKAFSLEEGQVVPPEFKVGDEVELHLEVDPTAEIWGIENSKGCYLFKHIPSGKEFKTWHRAEAYRFHPLLRENDTRPCTHQGCKGTQTFKRKPNNIPNTRAVVSGTRSSPVVEQPEWAWLCDEDALHYELPKP